MIPLIAAAAVSVVGSVVKSGQSVKAAQTELKSATAQTDAMRAAFEVEKTKLAQIQAQGQQQLQAIQQPTDEQAKKKKILLYGGIAAGALLLIGLIIFFVTRKK
ncbi:hypothetical protein QNI19_16475 [Cytophagaceae bacterium DM2B3-1]|uniref:Uncharacterized protein n=1 Tax=Xanthocytophaga flava TaxID=3048013 RepID=A0ABT7CNH2_9BACT|nr:hypothetical protein [Xanthocytophaga flavus]MDJ1494542.1 hypothetical protein [Xanthocytophaga flavus]